MKQGRTLQQVAKQIQSDAKARKDFRVPTPELHFSDEGTIGFKVKRDNYAVTPTNHCMRQICSRSRIPADYVDRMQEAKGGALIAENINWWWRNKPEKRMLRTLMNGSQVGRAFVSERYRPLENVDLVAAVLPTLEQLGCEVLSCEVTETRLYLQAATPRIEAKLVGDRVRAGVVIGNSEVGAGSLFEDELLWYLACKNGMIATRLMGRHHIGRRNDPLFELDTAAEYYTDATREMDDRAFWMKVKDATTALFNKDRFLKRVADFEATTEQKIKPVEAVEEITTRFRFSENEKEAVLNHLIEGKHGNNLFGLINAVTRTATDVESYDRSIDLQRFGGEIMELPKSTWAKH